MSPFQTVTLDSTQTVLLARAGENVGPDGWLITARYASGTFSLVFKYNTAPPGSAASYTNVAYQTGGTWAAVSAGTAITAAGSIVVRETGYDLYVTDTWTSGAVTLDVAPANIESTGASGGLAAADITAGTFGSATGATGTYKFPSLFSSTTAFATPSALTATTFDAFASTVSGAVVMGYGTTHDVALKNRAGTTILGVGPNTTTLTAGGSLTFVGGTPATHVITLEGVTLAANTNAIRGASVNPTRTSGWISFSGTISTSPAQCYTDYRELHSTGAAEVLGIGSFPFMDSGATGKSMYALQAICEADSGATIGAATAVGDGVFPIWAKCLVNSASANASAVMGAAFLSFQANVTDVSALDSSMINMEIASGGIRSIFKVQDSASGGATYLLDFTDDLGKPCSLTNGSDLNDISATANAGWIKCRIGSTTRYIPLYAAKA